MATPKMVIIGAGVAGLTVAALLAGAGLDVTVLEAHIEPGGCAATFFHKNYHFDAGATLVGGFQPGGPHDIVAQRLGIRWPVRRVEPGMIFHSPEGSVTRWGEDEKWREERQRLFGRSAEPFWRSQEWVADRLWAFSSALPPWPPRGLDEGIRLARMGLRQPKLLALAPLLLANMRQWMRWTGGEGELLEQFVDGQLLISAQGSAEETTALFGAVALDLARAGLFHVRGGVGAIARTLASRAEELGARILYRAEATEIRTAGGRVREVRTRKRGSFEADIVVANLTPWNIIELLGPAAPPGLERRVHALSPTWGAFTLYLGVDERAIPAGFPEHHQIIQQPDLPLAEGNSLFLSVSPAWDQERAPAGQRTVTMSTHTRPAPWWVLRQREGGREAYQARVARYTETLLRGASGLLPTIREHTRLLLPGTPVTFESFTRRQYGYVGGFSQRSLLATSSPRLPVQGLWMVGDSIFPGQSTAGVTLGALRVTEEVLREIEHSRRGVMHPALRERLPLPGREGRGR